MASSRRGEWRPRPVWGKARGKRPTPDLVGRDLSFLKTHWGCEGHGGVRRGIALFAPHYRDGALVLAEIGRLQKWGSRKM